MNENLTIHPSAIVDDGAQIGDGSRIWHFVHVCAGARIGKDCSLGQNVFIGNNVVIGENCKIQNNVSVYDNVTLEDNVFCGPSMVFTNVYNPRAGVSRKDEYRDTLVHSGATLGANCTIICGTEIGKYAFIAAGALVRNNVPSYALMVGVPAKQVGWMSEFGEQLDLPLTGESSCKCKNSGVRYFLEDGEVRKVDEIGVPIEKVIPINEDPISKAGIEEEVNNILGNVKTLLVESRQDTSRSNKDDWQLSRKDKYSE